MKLFFIKIFLSIKINIKIINFEIIFLLLIIVNIGYGTFVTNMQANLAAEFADQAKSV